MLKSINIFNTLDSTNLHAIRLIGEGLSVHAQLIIAYHQTAGRGQREKKWQDTSHDSLLMSLILHDELDKLSIIDLNIIVALSVHEVLNKIVRSEKLKIKWPNDIYLNEKKLVGILIENGFKGSKWSHSIIGIGVNVNQETFNDPELKAISLYQVLGSKKDVVEIGKAIAENILKMVTEQNSSSNELLKYRYEKALFKYKEEVKIFHFESQIEYVLTFDGIDQWGRALFHNKENIDYTFPHGSIEWRF